MTPTLEITHVSLRVLDLPASRDFYVQHIGFVPVHESDDRLDLAVTADSPPILSLARASHGATRAPDAAGLFHAALLFPSRAALGSWLAFAASHHLEFDGFSDHGVSEAIYFSDPDGDGLEFYADRPRADWPFHDGELAMVTRPLAVRSLLDRATPSSSPLAGTRWGHLHLRVTDLERSEAFYRDTLGLDVMQRSYPGARFLAADGYHHHLGLNTWGNVRHPQPDAAPGLESATFARADAEPADLIDPDGIRLHITPLTVPA